MASGARLVGGEKLRKDILALNPGDRRRVVDPALLECGLLVLRVAATQKIKRGGKGPPIAGKLTSRTGTLRRSLGSNFAIDKQGLRGSQITGTAFIEVGTGLVYGAVHEFGNATHPPRPFLKPAFDDTFQSFDEIFVKHWARAAKL